MYFVIKIHDNLFIWFQSDFLAKSIMLHNNEHALIGLILIYRKVSNISRTLVDNKIVDHSDVVGASPVGAAPTTSSFST